MKKFIEMFFSLKKNSRTRGHDVKLVKDQCRSYTRKYSFSQRTINEWNKLSMDCVAASSMNMFKNKDDTYLKRAAYTSFFFGLLISQWLPCPLAIWAFGLDGKYCEILYTYYVMTWCRPFVAGKECVFYVLS